MKKNRMKNLCLFFMLVLTGALLLSACSKVKAAPPDQVVDAFYQLVITGDTQGAKDVLGYTDDDIEELLGIQRDGSIAVIKANLSASGLYEATDEDAMAMLQAQTDAFKKLTCTQEVTSQDKSKSKSTVTLKTNYYDITALDQQAFDEAAEEYGLENVIDEASAEELIKLYIAKFQDIMGKAEPSNDQKEVVVNLEKVKGNDNGKIRTMWLPTEAEKFGNDLINAVSGL